ncbi:MAG: hypothetical protein KAX49_03755 [Halanaerobiales bacterium]|nr:hypothetical protein [Halanaerobiales bacterium]
MKTLSVKEIEEAFDEVHNTGFAMAKRKFMDAVREKAKNTIIAELNFLGMHKLIEVPENLPSEYRIILPGHNFGLDDECNNVRTDKSITLMFRRGTQKYDRSKYQYEYYNFE